MASIAEVAQLRVWWVATLWFEEMGFTRNQAHNLARVAAEYKEGKRRG